MSESFGVRFRFRWASYQMIFLLWAFARPSKADKDKDKTTLLVLGVGGVGGWSCCLSSVDCWAGPSANANVPTACHGQASE